RNNFCQFECSGISKEKFHLLFYNNFTFISPKARQSQTMGSTSVPKCLKVFGLAPKCLNRSHHHEANSLPLRYRMTRHPPYRGDKLSRPAPPSELSKRRSPCGIRSLAEDRTLGAHFAGRLAFDLTSKRHRIELFPHSRRGARLRSTPGALTKW